MQELIILGAGGFAREVSWLISELNSDPKSPQIKLHGFVGRQSNKSHLHGLKILGDDDWALTHISTSVNFVIAIGQSSFREKLAHRYEGQGFQSVKLQHPSVRSSAHISVGQGSILCAGSSLTTDISIGRHVIVNLHCTIGHDVLIEDYATLAPGVHVSGGVHIGQLVKSEVERYCCRG